MTDKVSDTTKAVVEMGQSWQVIKTLIGGTIPIRQAGKTYLPQWPNESDESHRARINTATLYPAFKRTVDVLAAKPFSKPLTLSDNVPGRIVGWLDNVDLQGRNLQAFASEVFKDCIGYGITGVLVDYPKVQGINTLAAEKATGVRPYFVRYPPGTVLGWRVARVNGADKLVQLRLKEVRMVPEGDYGEREIVQIRVLTPGTWQLWQESEERGEWALVDEGTTTLSEIPFVAFYGNRTGLLTGETPLLDLIYQNIEHYQSSSDQQTILHVARVPILTMIGADPDVAVTVGASTAVKLPMGSDMKFVEHSGAAIEAGRQSLLDLEERMRSTGSELLVLQPGRMTATQVHSENEGNKCALQRIAENFEDALDQCLQHMAEWIGEAEGGNVELFKDFGAASLNDASAQLLLQTNTAGKISDQTLLAEYKRRGILSADLDYEVEQDRIGDQGIALGAIGQ